MTHPGILGHAKESSQATNIAEVLSPSTHHSKLITVSNMSSLTSETKVNRGELRMRQFFQEQKHLSKPTALSPKRTPINKSRMVIRDSVDADRLAANRAEESKEE